MRRRIFPLIVILLAGSVAGQAATYTVQKNGTGDFTTLADAYAAAADGDVIRIGAGSYTESVIIAKDLELEAISGPSVTVLDGGGTMRPLEVTDQSIVTIRGLTVRNGYADNGSALFIWVHSTVVVDGCVFEENHAWESNAVHARHAGTNVTVVGCDFLRNTAVLHSAALSVSQSAYMNVIDCRFVENVAGGDSGALNVDDATLDVSGCLFLRNESPRAGALACTDSYGTIANNTFHGNRGTERGSVYLEGVTDFHHNIITSEQQGPGLTYSDWGARYCNLYWNNPGGPIFGAAPTSDELVVEPGYCDFTLDDFSLSSVSPAAMGTCGLIGAFGIGCEGFGPVPTEDRTWGDVKAMYR